MALEQESGRLLQLEAAAGSKEQLFTIAEPTASNAKYSF